MQNMSSTIDVRYCCFCGFRFSDDSFPRLAVCTNSGIEVTENDELIFLGHRSYEALQVCIEPLFGLLGVSHSRGICTDNGGVALAFQGYSQMHEPVIQSLGETGQLAD